MTYFLIKNAHIMIATIEELEVDFSCLIAKNNPRINLGSMACRKLLFHLQKKLNLIQPYQRIVLNESQFPYDFMVNDKTYWVSFSHSQTQVAVMVVVNNKSKNVPKKLGTQFGIDIEDKRISDAVARRFFCQAELDWLSGLDIERQSHAKKLLWTLKESLIKSEVNEKLVLGLKNNLLALLDEKALNELLQENRDGFNQVTTENGIFGFSPRLKCGWVMDR